MQGDNGSEKSDQSNVRKSMIEEEPSQRSSVLKLVSSHGSSEKKWNEDGKGDSQVTSMVPSQQNSRSPSPSEAVPVAAAALVAGGGSGGLEWSSSGVTSSRSKRKSTMTGVPSQRPSKRTRRTAATSTSALPSKGSEAHVQRSSTPPTGPNQIKSPVSLTSSAATQFSQIRSKSVQIDVDQPGSDGVVTGEPSQEVGDKRRRSSRGTPHGPAKRFYMDEQMRASIFFGCAHHLALSCGGKQTYAWTLTAALRSRIDESCPMSMPDDFFQLFFHCVHVAPANPKKALYKAIGVVLCGPFDYTDSEIDDWVLHCRYFYDVPQFTTIARVPRTGIHLGYYRHLPCDLPSFVAINDETRNCKFKKLGNNIFSALRTFASLKRKSRLIFKPVPSSHPSSSSSLPSQSKIDSPSTFASPDQLESALNAIGRFFTERNERILTCTSVLTGHSMLPFCRLISELPLAVVDQNGVSYNGPIAAISNQSLVDMLDSICERRATTTGTSSLVNIKANEDKAKEAMTELEELIEKSQKPKRPNYAHILKLALNLFLYGDSRLNERAYALAATAISGLGPKYQLFKLIIDSHWNNEARKRIGSINTARRRKPKHKHHHGAGSTATNNHSSRVHGNTSAAAYWA